MLKKNLKIEPFPNVPKSDSDGEWLCGEWGCVRRTNSETKTQTSMYKNDDPFKPWNNPMIADHPDAPHNGIDRDNPFKPWNDPFGRIEELDEDERRWYDEH